jgi:RNA polymerase sigma-70 factor (ECF subfamily)
MDASATALRPLVSSFVTTVETRSAAMHVDEELPTTPQLEAGWDETFSRLRSFIAGRVGNDDVAADIAQDVLVRSIAAGALQHVDNPTAWLYRSARNAVIDHYRTRHIHDPLSETAEQWPEPAPADDRPNDATRELARCLQPLVSRLPDIYREAVSRVDLAGQSHHLAAAEVGISTSGMKSRVQRGRRQLKELLTDCCAVNVDRLGAVASYRQSDSTCGCHSSD